MDQGASKTGYPLMTEPEVIRAEMAQTRARLARKLDALKSRLFGTTTPARKGRESTVAQKRKAATKTKSSAAKGGTKTKVAASAGKTTSKAKKSGGGKKSTASRRNPVTKVLSTMAAGAAVGAVKGAAEAVVTEAGLMDKNPAIK